MNENTGKTKKELQKEDLETRGALEAREWSCGSICRGIVPHDTGFEHV